MSIKTHAAKKKNSQSLLEQVLDVMEGGPKLRRWYGSDSSVGDGSSNTNDEDTDVGFGSAASDGDTPTLEDLDEDVELALPRRSVCVTSAESSLGESVVMQLIVANVPVVAVCEDASSAERRFGPYATFASEKWSAGARLNGVRSVVASGALEDDFLDACVRRKVKHIVLVSCAKSAMGAGGVFASAGEKSRRDRGRESAAKKRGLALTIIRPCAIKREPGGARAIEFAQGDTISGEVSMEDLAAVCARALSRPPPPGQTLEFEVRNVGAVCPADAPPTDWNALFEPLRVS